MNTVELKANLLELVETAQNEPVLKAVLTFFKDAVSKKEGPVWQQLTEDEKNEVMESFLESENEKNWISVESAFEKLRLAK